MWSRRAWLAALAGLPPLPGLAAGAAPAGLAPRPLRFPRDHGSHPAQRTEWWYITGHARSGAREFGFQVTFFRSRVDGTQGLRSGFAARQLLFAHAAVTDVAGGRLRHDQRIARSAGRPELDQSSASETDTDLRLRDWTLRRSARGYHAEVQAGDFALALDCAPTQPLLLQGDQGWSRKGPDARQASFYYSQPQLATRGRLTLDGQVFEVTGRAWLDHEWSEELLHPRAVGWDWLGMNLADGSALTAFRLRDGQGGTVWDGGSWRPPAGVATAFRPGTTHFEPLRHWTSPLTQARYPVAWRVTTPAGVFTVQAVLPAQELDSRGSTGAVYWEGLSELFDSQQRRVGRGYLEMTGYAGPLRL